MTETAGDVCIGDGAEVPQKEKENVNGHDGGELPEALPRPSAEELEVGSWCARPASGERR